MRRSPDVLWRAGDQFLVLAHVDGTVVRFAGSATDVWTLLDIDRSLDELTAVLADRYRLDRDSIRGDVAAMIDQLRSRAFVTGD